MNEENKWDHGKSAEVKEGPADCIMIGEVVTALKKVKRRIKLQVCRGYQQKWYKLQRVLELSGYGIM